MANSLTPSPSSTRCSPARRSPSGASGSSRSSGQWAIAQDTLEVADDPQTVANGYLVEYETAGGTPFRLVSVPMQYDGEPASSRRAPEFNEHGDAILESIGLDMDQIIDLKIRNIVA